QHPGAAHAFTAGARRVAAVLQLAGRGHRAGPVHRDFHRRPEEAAMMDAIPSWQRRTLAVLILAALASGIWSALVWPAMTLLENHRQWRAETLQTLAHHRALAAKRADFEAVRKQVANHPIWQRLYPVADASAAAAQLQGDLQHLYD